jgi:AcrR family transcriptional regulator
MARSFMARRSRPLDTAPRKRPRQSRARVTRDIVVIAAERVLERHGIAGLSTNRIAELAGVGIGSVYHYFPNKHAVLAALVERNVDQYIEAVQRSLAQHREASPEIATFATICAVREVFIAQARVHRDLFQQIPVLRLTEAYEQAFAKIVDVLADYLVASPWLAMRDARTAAFVIVHAIEGVLRAHAMRPSERDMETVARETCAMVLAYLPRAR